MAKAYLSRSGSRQKAAMVKALGQALPAMAIQEARAILAETEPLQGALFADSYAVAYRGYEALAESLVAFETMTVEQLAKLQQS